MTLEIAQSTPTANAIARFVERHYDLGPVVHAEFMRRSFNQVYRLDFANGRRAVARLSADRPRGAPNVEFEAQLLDHLAREGCGVARGFPTRDGAAALDVPLPEGPRKLLLVEFLDGEFTSEDARDIEAFAHGLARLHEAGTRYAGVPSRYTLDLDYLLWRPLERLLRAPTMTEELRPAYERLAQRLADRIGALGTLTQVICHGDAHGENNFIIKSDRDRDAVFFDFDEAGPGLLAYELAVYPWCHFPRLPDTPPSEKALLRWGHFIRAYRAAHPVPHADLAAIPRFIAVRQFWLNGEYAGRVSTWGSQTMTTAYLRRQVTRLEQWEALELPL